jgi:predicted RNase H-like HicB family nuclease
LTYTVVIKRAKDGRYAVSVPALNGLATEGDSLPHALRMAEEAILAYLEGLAIVGRQPPVDMPEVSVALGEADEAMVYRVTVAEEAAVA